MQTVYIENLPNSVELRIPLEAKIEALINIEGYATNIVSGGYYYRFPLPKASEDNGTCIDSSVNLLVETLDAESSNLVVRTYSNWTEWKGYVTVFYTKL
jgi:hypothetical protein